MLVEDVKDEGTDTDVEDTEGVEQQQHHRSIILEVAFCLGQDGDVLSLKHH